MSTELGHSLASPVFADMSGAVSGRGGLSDEAQCGQNEAKALDASFRHGKRKLNGCFLKSELFFGSLQGKQASTPLVQVPLNTILAVPSPFSSRILLFKKWANAWKIGWFLKRMLSEENGDSSLRTICSPSLEFSSYLRFGHGTWERASLFFPPDQRVEAAKRTWTPCLTFNVALTWTHAQGCLCSPLPVFADFRPRQVRSAGDLGPEQGALCGPTSSQHGPQMSRLGAGQQQACCVQTKRAMPWDSPKDAWRPKWPLQAWLPCVFKHYPKDLSNFRTHPIDHV